MFDKRCWGKDYLNYFLKKLNKCTPLGVPTFKKSNGLFLLSDWNTFMMRNEINNEINLKSNCPMHEIKLSQLT